MLKIILLIFMIGFASAVEVDLDCPDDIFIHEEFECRVEVIDGDGVYDLKIEADKERNSILRILDGEVWKSGYYYLKEFVRDDAIVKLIVSREGKYDVVLKLRQGDESVEFDVGRISVEERDVVATIWHDSADPEDESAVVEKDVFRVIRMEKSNEIIMLGGDVVVEYDEEWDYISRDGQIVDWLIYGFCLFLILLVGFLMWERF